MKHAARWTSMAAVIMWTTAALAQAERPLLSGRWQINADLSACHLPAAVRAAVAAAASAVDSAAWAAAALAVAGGRTPKRWSTGAP